MQVVGGKPAGPDADRKAGDLADQKTRQDRLTLLERDGVADPGHRQRNDRCSADAGQQPGRQQRRMADGQRTQDRCRGRGQAGPGDDAVFAEAISHRTENQLRKPVGDRVDRDHLRRLAERDREFLRQARQQGVGQSQRDAAAHGSQRQPDNGKYRHRRGGAGVGRGGGSGLIRGGAADGFRHGHRARSRMICARR